MLALPVRAINAILDRILSVIGAVAFSQFPQLVMQYRRALEGALVEARRNIEVASAKAAEVGLSLQDFIAAHIRNSEPIFQQSGKVYQEALLRKESYEAALAALAKASIWTKPFVFFIHFDSEIFLGMDFTPGLPLTLEGGVYAFLGILFALAFYHGIVLLPFRHS